METTKGRVIVATWAAALCGAVTVQAAAVTAQDARAPSAGMALVVFEDIPGSEALLRGDYETGLRQSLEALERSPARNAFQLASNICVAHLKLGRMQAAQERCGAVIEHRIDRREGVAMARRYQAVALVNHGVLLSVQGDAEAASEQFAEARHRFPELGVARSNLQHAGRAPSVTVGDEP